MGGIQYPTDLHDETRDLRKLCLESSGVFRYLTGGIRKRQGWEICSVEGGSCEVVRLQCLRKNGNAQK